MGVHGLSDCAGARHRALIYEDPGCFVDAIARFVLDGLRDDDRVLVAVTPEKFGWLRDALGDDAAAVGFTDSGALYERHGPMFATVVNYLSRHGSPGRGRVRIVAEQALAWRTPVDVRAYMRYEAAANVMYRRFAASVLCPYDASRLPELVVLDALRTHPEVLDGERPRRNEAFVDPRVFVRGQINVVAAPRGSPAIVLERLENVASARRRVAEFAEAAGLPGPKIEELTVAVSEVATNALIHGRAPRCLWIYRRDGALVCHVADGGRGLPDPLVGYLVPDLDADGGRGLWLAHQLCDVVETAGDETGTHVYLQMTF
jgi:anti-sigma regulatory factor (Ser/Thr protein kinase)